MKCDEIRAELAATQIFRTKIEHFLNDLAPQVPLQIESY